MAKDIHASVCISHAGTREAFKRMIILKGCSVLYLNKKSIKVCCYFQEKDPQSLNDLTICVNRNIINPLYFEVRSHFRMFEVMYVLRGVKKKCRGSIKI